MRRCDGCGAWRLADLPMVVDVELGVRDALAEDMAIEGEIM